MAKAGNFPWRFPGSLYGEFREFCLTENRCAWKDVIRLHIYLVSTVDPRSVFQVFQPVLALRASPPLIGVYKVQELAHPDFLLEIGTEVAMQQDQK